MFFWRGTLAPLDQSLKLIVCTRLHNFYLSVHVTNVHPSLVVEENDVAGPLAVDADVDLVGRLVGDERLDDKVGQPPLGLANLLRDSRGERLKREVRYYVMDRLTDHYTTVSTCMF